jgi:hypothetical protein
MNSMEASLIVFSCVFGGGLPAPVPVRRRGPNTASPFLASGDSVPIGRVKPAARDRGLGGVGCAMAVTRGNCALSSAASLRSLETGKST